MKFRRVFKRFRAIPCHTGVYRAARGCLFVYGRHRFKTDKDNSVEGGSSEVDYVLLIDTDELALREAKSPSIMHKVSKVLLQRGIKLKLFPWSVSDTENSHEGEYASPYH